MQVLSLANIIVVVFYQCRNPFNFVLNIFYRYSACGWNYERNLSALFKIKLNHEITWSWSHEILVFVMFFETYLHLEQLLIKKYITKNYLKISIGGYQKHNWYIVLFQERYCTSGILLRTYFRKYSLIAISGVSPNSWKTFGKVRETEPLVCVLSLWYLLCVSTFTFLKVHWVISNLGN